MQLVKATYPFTRNDVYVGSWCLMRPGLASKDNAKREILFAYCNSY